MSDSVVLRGIQPQPLASYLAALGVLRVASKHCGRPVRGAFTDRGFRLDGIAPEELVDLVLRRWTPTPIVTPWNNASGFYASSKGGPALEAIEAILGDTSGRFNAFARVICQVRDIVASSGHVDAPKDEEKATFVAGLRNVLPDEVVAWLDAVAVVDGDDARMMPLLGSGGNEGVLDYSGLYMRSLVDTLMGDQARSERLLRAALFDVISSDLTRRPGGQFDPGSAGGFNTGPGFESKDLPNNPWAFVLLIEGTVVWASGVASRQQGFASTYRFAVSPFTVRHRAAGYGSAGDKDNDPQRVRAEVWVPVWRRPAGLDEVGRFIAEGRVDVRGRDSIPKRASDSMDFADAVASLGVDRGVDSFVRYALIKRRGDAFLALPAGSIDVHYRREADLLRALDAELGTLDFFLSRFPSEQGAPAQFASARGAIDEARFDVAARGGQDSMLNLVRAIGALERVLARRDPGKDPKLARPLGGLGSEWIDACGDSVEVRIAAALASVARTGNAAPFRMYVAPLDPKDSRRYAASARAVAWEGLDLADRLANVLSRRMLDVARGGGDVTTAGRNPTWGSYSAQRDDIATFLAADTLDDALLEDLIFGFTWINYGKAGVRRRTPPHGPPLPRDYALLKLLFLPAGVPRGDESVRLVPHASIVPLLRAGRVSDAVDRARAQLAAKGFRPRRVVEDDVLDAQRGRRLAASLLIPVTDVKALIDRALLPNATTTEDEPEELHDAH